MISRLLRLINIFSSEVKDVAICSYIAFIVKFLTVTGWSFLIVYFIELYDFDFLINLFFTHGTAMILGFFLFKNIFNKFKVNDVFIALISVLSILFLLIPFLISNQTLFITFVFVAFSLLMNQVKIAKNLFTERSFSPIQSTRIFPVIESAETFAIIISGFLLLFSLKISIWKISFLFVLSYWLH